MMDSTLEYGAGLILPGPVSHLLDEIQFGTATSLRRSLYKGRHDIMVTGCAIGNLAIAIGMRLGDTSTVILMAASPYVDTAKMQPGYQQALTTLRDFAIGDEHLSSALRALGLNADK